MKLMRKHQRIASGGGSSELVQHIISSHVFGKDGVVKTHRVRKIASKEATQLQYYDQRDLGPTVIHI